MPRASTIWVVTGETGKPIATFTVKHEMIRTLEVCHKDDRRKWSIRKFPDGHGIVAGLDVGGADQFLAANAD